MKVDIHQLCRDAAEIERDHGFGDQSFGEDIALMHSELSEALEEYRSHKPELYFGPDQKPEGALAELADVVIRIAAYCGRKKLDLANALHLKVNYNRTRPHRHGNKAL